MSTGSIIKIARKKQGLTQSKLRELLGVEKSTIQKYENGYVTNLKLETIRGLYNHLGIYPMMLVFPADIDTLPAELTRYQHNQMFMTLLALNQMGQSKIYEYMMDVLEIKKYQKQGKS